MVNAGQLQISCIQKDYNFIFLNFTFLISKYLPHLSTLTLLFFCQNILWLIKLDRQTRHNKNSICTVMPTYLRAPLAVTVYFFHSSLLSAVIKTFFNENIYTNKQQQQCLQNRKQQAGSAARHSPPTSEVNITFLKNIFNKIRNPTQGYSGAMLRNVSKSFFKVPF